MLINKSIGLCLLYLLVRDASGSHCPEALDVGDFAKYPKHPLTFEELNKYVLGGGNSSKIYHEVYALNSLALRAFGLPVLRKVSIRWNKVVDGPILDTYTNDFTGWNPYNSTHPCAAGIVNFESLYRSDLSMGFKFFSHYPQPESFIGTSFSSCPGKYLINWYCPENKLEPKVGKIKYCAEGVRMNIYSSVGPHNMPWHSIIDDMCRNGVPKMDDQRWVMTHDAPQQCEIDIGKRKKRDAYSYSDIRYYM